MTGPFETVALQVLGTGILAVLLTAFQIRLNGRLKLNANPRSDRWHRKTTPSSGGLAVFCAFAAMYLACYPGRHADVVAGTAALWALGLLDDRWRLRPWLKLAGQAAVAALVVAGGVVFRATHWPTFNVAFCFVWLVGVTNAFNLIDNMDGLCAGVTAIVAAFRFTLLAANGYWADAALSAMLGAAFAGFLVFNYRPARIFMGDCGSMVAGFGSAALAISSPLPYTKVFTAALFYPALTFAYPIFDTVLVSVLRRMAGRPISQGGRDHSSHRLVAAGLNERQVVWILWVLTAAGGSIGLMVHRRPLGLIAAGGLIALLLLLGIFLATLPSYPIPGSRLWLRLAALRGRLDLPPSALQRLLKVR